jgi:GT2 family glycosyltransferase
VTCSFVQSEQRVDGEQRVDVVIPSYDGSDLLDRLLRSLSRQTFVDFRVTVVDNGSTDALTGHVCGRWPGTDVVTLDRNIGVGAAINRAIASTSAPFVAVLNNDIELERSWLEELVRALERYPEAGSAVGKLLRHHPREELDGAGDIIRWSSATTRRGYGEVDRGQYNAEEWVFSACGAAALYRRAAFEDVGLFDEDFFAYHEDVDWGFRAQLLGYRCRYVPTAVAYHVGSATTTKDSHSTRHYAYLLRRNSVALVLKNYPATALARHFPAILGHHLRWLVKSAATGLLTIHLSAYAGAVVELPSTLAKRRQIQRRRRVDLKYLDTVVSRRSGYDLLGLAGRGFSSVRARGRDVSC